SFGGECGARILEDKGTPGAQMLLEQTLNPSLPLPFEAISQLGVVEFAAYAKGYFREQGSQILNSEELSFEQSFLRLDRFLAELRTMEALFESVYWSLMMSDQSEFAYSEFHKLSLSLRAEFFQNSNLRSRFEQIAKNADFYMLSPASQKTRRRLMAVTLDQFERAGASLSEQDKQERLRLDSEISKWESKFTQAVSKERAKVRVLVDRESRLQGLSSEFISEAKERAEVEGQSGMWSFAVVGPAYINILSEARDRKLREEFFTLALRASPNIGAYSTETTLLSGESSASLEAAKRMVELRAQRAKLMGFEYTSDQVTATQTAKTTSAVEGFLTELVELAKPVAEKEWKQLSELARADGVADLAAWDVMFYRERSLEAFLQIASSELNAFFELEGVLSRTLSVLGEVFNLHFIRDESLSQYHDEDVAAYRVERGNETKEVLGFVYLDLYGRATKGGAFISTLKSRRYIGEGALNSPASVVVSYNFPRPSKDKSVPNLLSFEQLRTLLHELGHVMHAILADTEFHTLSGPDAVPYDFVEFPSKLFENWITDASFMEKVARHHLDESRTLPADVLKRLSKAQNFMPGLLYLSKGVYSLLDLEWHKNGLQSGESVQDFEKRVVAKYLLHDFYGDSTLSSTFTHVFAGSEYASLFYSYLYSQAFADVAFERFATQGSLSPKVGAALERGILSAGGLTDAASMFEVFTGQTERSFEAFFERIGLFEPK
ncbi:M3 family metallopeptidase, partial [bacterium]|nr:M3 family metallopeptidase [bacterium]